MSTPMTVGGAKALRAELEHLKGVRRPEIIHAIAEARAHGDLKENAEYHAAREQQGFVEARIKDIEGKLSDLVEIDVSTLKNEGKIVFGVTVTLYNTATEETVTYQIVGEDEANIKQGKISCTSPLTRAIIGKHEGDEVLVKTPGGDVTYEVEKIRFIA
jgi:transcription elongation factor GreA